MLKCFFSIADNYLYIKTNGSGQQSEYNECVVDAVYADNLYKGCSLHVDRKTRIWQQSAVVFRRF